MGFLIRTAFWFSLVLLMLPLNIGTDASGRDAVSPLQALLAAREAVGDIAGICERKPEVCETGKSAMHTISTRARETAKIAAEMLDSEGASGTDATATGTIPVPQPAPKDRQ
ncbi:DUF5330 domain-containing protein [Mesorhizobium sp. SP-1A]|uniref:DUF5330 domain-containing protein n=1 Tax=Mesorhizobium sp. SP-1A TaxID=3077840 RepID=UPI0028F7220E|nr:DUF5330 domain-containing protein [Mesorhizobium sp. SP-1A]